jgi:RNA recognition motif-containing protein
VEGVGLPPTEAASFPLPSGSLSRGGGQLTGEQKKQRLRDLDAVGYGLSLQQNCGERMQDEPFAPFPLLIPFGWRPDPVIQEKKDPAPKKKSFAHPLSKVFIGGLPPNTTEEDLRNYFGTYGRVATADILVDQDTRKSRGFAFVVFDGPVPDVVLCREHVFHGRSCGTRMYGEAPRPNAYMNGYFPNPNFRSDRYAKGKGKGEADGDAGKGKNQRHGRRYKQSNAVQSRDEAAAQRDTQLATEPTAQPAEAPN